MPTRRPVDVCVVSDVHLGTRGAHAEELLRYLKSIRPATLVLNGDIVDVWQFSRRYWTAVHTKVVKQVLHLSSKGTRVVYLAGNHDEKLRKFDGLHVGNLEIANTLTLTLGPTAEKTWFFHGDVFDAVMDHSRWLARVGAVGYDALLALNAAVNAARGAVGLGRVSLSRRVKNGVKSAVAFINDFELTAARFGAARGYDVIVCGHIHQPADRTIVTPRGECIRYLNAGDWVENLTALEYDGTQWRTYRYDDDPATGAPEPAATTTAPELEDLTERELFRNLLAELTA